MEAYYVMMDERKAEVRKQLHGQHTPQPLPARKPKRKMSLAKRQAIRLQRMDDAARDQMKYGSLLDLDTVKEMELPSSAWNIRYVVGHADEMPEAL